MDITSLFKARMDIVRNRNKALGTAATNNTQIDSSGHLKRKLFPARKPEYYAKARELVLIISHLRDYLEETRSPYLNVDNNMMSLEDEFHESKPVTGKHYESLTEFEKDQVDMNILKIIQNNQKRITEFQNLINRKGIEDDYPQLYIHLGNIINSIIEYLKEVCGQYAQMKAIRVKRSLDLQTISKITSSSNRTKEESIEVNEGDTKWNRLKINASFEDEIDPFAMYDTQYTPEELQMLEEENSVLLESLNTMADEVEQIESSVVQIAQLQEIFAEKVLLQDKEISHISNVVIGTTENIKDGNEQLRQAIQQNADFRAWVLFFIIVMSLSLLFLDWYND